LSLASVSRAATETGRYAANIFSSKILIFKYADIEAVQILGSYPKIFISENKLSRWLSQE
jgi:hypothetical protein